MTEYEEIQILSRILNKIIKLRMGVIPDLEVAIGNCEKECEYMQKEIEILIKVKEKKEKTK